MSEFLQREEVKAKAQSEETWSQEFIKILRGSLTHALAGLFVGGPKVVLSKFSGTFISKALKEYVWEDYIKAGSLDEVVLSGASDYGFRYCLAGKSLHVAVVEGPINFIGYKICGSLGFSDQTCTAAIETAEGYVIDPIVTAALLSIASSTGFLPALWVSAKIGVASTLVGASFEAVTSVLSQEQQDTPNIDWLISTAQGIGYVGGAAYNFSSSTYAFLTSLKDFHEFEDGSETNLGWYDLAKNTVNVAAYAGAYAAKFLGDVASGIEWLSGN